MSWEIRKVSTPEDIYARIEKEDPHPVGVVLFGADWRNKKDIVQDFSTRMPCCHSAIGSEMLFRNGLNCLVEMSGDDSGDHNRRHWEVTTLRNAGAKTVIGVYVKDRPIVRHADSFLPPVTRFNEQVARLLKEPPTAEGLDYLIVIDK